MKLSSDYTLERSVQAGVLDKLGWGKKNNAKLFEVKYTYAGNQQTAYLIAKDEDEVKQKYNYLYKIDNIGAVPDNDLSYGSPDAKFYDVEGTDSTGKKNYKLKMKMRDDSSQSNDSLKRLGLHTPKVKLSKNQKPAYTPLPRAIMPDDYDEEIELEQPTQKPAYTPPARTPPAYTPPARTPPAKSGTNVFKDQSVVSMLLKKGLTSSDINRLVRKGITIPAAPVPAPAQSSRFFTGGRYQVKLTGDYSRVACGPIGSDVESCGVEGKKKGKAVNPWAICHSSVGPEKGKKFEDCVQDVKSKHKIKKD